GLPEPPCTQHADALVHEALCAGPGGTGRQDVTSLLPLHRQPIRSGRHGQGAAQGEWEGAERGSGFKGTGLNGVIAGKTGPHRRHVVMPVASVPRKTTLLRNKICSVIS